MKVYKVGDHIEQIDTTTGNVIDTAVVTQIKGDNIWAVFDSISNREYYFRSRDAEFRVKAQEQQPELITEEITAPNAVQELAIIRDIHVGMRDCLKPVVYFTVDMLYGSSLQVIEDIPAFIRETGCCKLEDLEGNACVVEKTSDRMIKYVRLKK